MTWRKTTWTSITALLLITLAACGGEPSEPAPARAEVSGHDRRRRAHAIPDASGGPSNDRHPAGALNAGRRAGND